MSEKIYAWLLRLYPSHFREAYGESALQLFRDRGRHERSFFRALRLWLDLLFDLAISVPRQYHRVQPVFTPALRSRDDTPSFHVLERQSPRPAALLLGGVRSLAAASAPIPIGRIQLKAVLPQIAFRTSSAVRPAAAIAQGSPRRAPSNY
jgi:hypothetical protein